MDKEYAQILAKIRLDRAIELLQESQELLEKESYKSANNRAFYAIEKSIKALLAIAGIEAHTRRGTLLTGIKKTNAIQCFLFGKTGELSASALNFVCLKDIIAYFCKKYSILYKKLHFCDFYTKFLMIFLQIIKILQKISLISIKFQSSPLPQHFLV